MSNKVTDWVYAHGPRQRSERLVLLSLADRANDDGRCYPSLADIARRCAMTERGIRGILRRLEKDSWIATRIGGGRGGTSLYTVLMPDSRNAVPGNSEKPGTDVPRTRNRRSAKPLEPNYSDAYASGVPPLEESSNASGLGSRPIESDTTSVHATRSSAEDASKRLFAHGAAFLVSYGTPERQARSVIGRWRKAYTDPEIDHAFKACSQNGTVDPIPWITARLRGRRDADNIININRTKDSGHEQHPSNRPHRGNSADEAVSTNWRNERRGPQGPASQFAAALARAGVFDGD